MFTPRPSSSSGAVRRFLAAACVAALGPLAAASPVTQTQTEPQEQQAPAQGQKPAQEQKPAQTAAGEQQPTFRTEANFVRVDVYPTADGRPVQDLRQADFEVFEDGQRQEVRTFEHVLIQSGGSQDTRVEPTSVRQSQDMVADPRARLFVLFLDTYHVSREGAYNVRRALTRLLERTIAPTDFIALMTPEMSAGSVTFTRRTGSMDEVLDKWVNWGRRFEAVMDPDPVEARYQQCYPTQGSQTDIGGVSQIAYEMIARRREKLTIDAMRDLVLHLQGLREERKAILMVSEGWALYRPNSNLARMTDGRVPGPPPVGVGPEGGLRVGDLGRNVGGASNYECDQDRLRLSQEDHEREFRELLDEANRGNSTFYTVDPRGLPVFDSPINGQIGSPALDQAMLTSRQDALRTLAGATDGVAVMNSNDIDKGLKRVVDDLTSYYLIGYYSSNAKPDGKFHSISVKVKRPGVSVRARRGYRSPTKEEVEAVTRGESAGPKAEASPVAKAVGVLAKVRENAAVHATAGYEWLASDQGGPKPSLWVMLELDPSAGIRDEQWKAGADVKLTVTGADKSTIAEATPVLTREARSTMVRIPAPATLPGDFAIRVTSKPSGATLGSTETLRVVVPKPAEGGPIYGQPLLYRRGPFSGPAWQAAGDPRFRRQERVKVELPVVGEFTGAEVQLLDRTGKPLSNIPVTAATRDENGRKIISGEVTLAPLTTGDYVLETTLRAGETTQKIVAAFRIIP